MADLTLKQAFAKNKEKADNRYAKPDGFYERMGVGRALLAENLVAQLGTLDTDAYQFRTAGGNADIAGIKKVHKIVGRTIKWNQLAVLSRASATVRGITFTNNSDGSLSVTGTSERDESLVIGTFDNTAGHKFFARAVFYSGKPTSSSGYWIKWKTATSGKDYGDDIFFSGTETESSYIMFTVDSDNVAINCRFKLQIIDLTDIFGAGDEPTTMAQFYATDLGKLVQAVGYLDYTEGSIATTDIIKMRNVGYNAFDGELEQGTIFTNGSLGPDSKSFRTKNYIRGVPGKRYKLETVSPETSIYDTVRWFCYDISFNPVGTRGGVVTGRQNATIDVPENAAYIKIAWENTTTDIDVPTNPVIAFHLEWSGSRTGYEEYKAHEYPAVFKGYGVNGVGDEYYPDGRIVRKFGIMDLGTLTWTKGTRNRFVSSSISSLVKKPSADDIVVNAFCQRFVNTAAVIVYLNEINNVFAVNSDGVLFIYINAAYYNNTDDDTFKQAMSGVYLIYELATPTTETGQPYDEEQIVDDYGTEEFVFKSGEMPVPVGHETFYQVNLQNFVQRMYQGLEGDAGNVAKADDLEALDNRVEALEGSRLYKHTVRAVSGSETFNLMIVSPISTQLNTVLLLEEAYEAGKIVQCTGTFVNGGTTENVMNAMMQNNLFGVSLINATNQTVVCRVVAGTVTDTVELL